MADLEATITLTPLTTRTDPHDDFVRVLKINPSNTTVVVGRASKNVDKGLVAARENAWFDSPIMSRKHAVFSINPENKAAFIQDFKSTHGTFISGRKLLQYENCRLKDWDVITFGVKITAGTETYPPRAFTVNLSWRSWNEPSLLFTPWPTGTFQVPEDDHDSSSEISRADSLQILASHARTYSVPSTDDEWDDDDCVALERGEARDSLTTTPYLPASFSASSSTIQNRVEANPIDRHREVNEKSESASVGASQANPIDIDQGQQQSINLDSDDDGPEILPIDPTPSAPMAREKSPGCSRPSAHNPDSQPSSALRKLSHDFGFDDSWLPQQRYDQDLIDNELFPEPDNVHGAPTRPLVADTYNHRNQDHGPRPHVSFGLPSGHLFKPMKNPFEDSSNPHLSSDNSSPNAITVDRSKATASIITAPRPPSPSDAALARKSSAALTSGEALHEQIIPDRSEELRSDDALSGPKISSKPYDVGPFSYAKKAPRVLTSLAPSPDPEDYPGNQYCDFLDTYRPPQYPQYPQFRPYSSSHTLFPRDNWERPHNLDTGYHSSYYKDPTGDRHVDGNPARVNIADLVNQSTSTPHDHNGLGQKRKASEMEDTTETSDEHAMAGALPTPESESFTLPDAQPREQSTLPLQSLTQESPVLRDTHSTVGSVQQNTLPSANTDNGPARKKVKTSSTKTTGIGKFVSGIAVGVASVVAAFIATIPASVREEALREINHAK